MRKTYFYPMSCFGYKLFVDDREFHRDFVSFSLAHLFPLLHEALFLISYVGFETRF